MKSHTLSDDIPPITGSAIFWKCNYFKSIYLQNNQNYFKCLCSFRNSSVVSSFKLSSKKLIEVWKVHSPILCLSNTKCTGNSFPCSSLIFSIFNTVTQSLCTTTTFFLTFHSCSTSLYYRHVVSVGNVCALGIWLLWSSLEWIESKWLNGTFR